MLPGPSGPGVHGRIWDPLVRLFHWTLAAAFFTAWFERSEAAIHETAGKVVLGLVIFRLGWGLIGPGTAQFRNFIRGPRATLAYIWSIIRGKPAHFLGHNPAGAAMILALLLSISTTSVSGILMTTTAFWGGEWIEFIHGWAATVTLWLIGGHLLGVVAASLQHRENLPLAMVTGRKWMAAKMPSYLGPMRLTLGSVSLALTVTAAAAGLWYGSSTVLNGSLWRLPKILTAAAKKAECEVQTVEGPRVEVYPAVVLRYNMLLAGGEEPVEVVATAEQALLERNPMLALPDFATICKAEENTITGTREEAGALAAVTPVLMALGATAPVASAAPPVNVPAVATAIRTDPLPPHVSDRQPDAMAAKTSTTKERLAAHQKNQANRSPAPTRTARQTSSPAKAPAKVKEQERTKQAAVTSSAKKPDPATAAVKKKRRKKAGSAVSQPAPAASKSGSSQTSSISGQGDDAGKGRGRGRGGDNGGKGRGRGGDNDDDDH